MPEGGGLIAIVKRRASIRSGDADAAARLAQQVQIPVRVVVGAQPEDAVLKGGPHRRLVGPTGLSTPRHEHDFLGTAKGPLESRLHVSGQRRTELRSQPFERRVLMLAVRRRPTVPSREALDERLRRGFGEKAPPPRRVDESIVIREEHGERTLPVAHRARSVEPEKIAGELASGARIGHKQVSLITREVLGVDCAASAKRRRWSIDTSCSCGSVPEQARRRMRMPAARV